MCQKIVNVLAIASTVVSTAVVGSGLYVYLNRASIIDGIKSQALEAVLGGTGGLPGVGDAALPELAPSDPSAPVPAGGLGIPN
tara:strand:+ start:77 stop:325 length:249 start_codon:yes stop_codon:yes gene_type:complete